MRGSDSAEPSDADTDSSDDSAAPGAATVPSLNGMAAAAASFAAARAVTPDAPQSATDPADEQQRFRLLADAMPHIVWTAGPDGSPDYGNRRWNEYTGLPFIETYRGDWQKALHPDDLHALDQWRLAVMAGEPRQFDCRFRRAADGAYRWHRCCAQPMCDANGCIILWVGTAADIDDQKRIEEALRETETREHSFLRDVLLAVTENKLRLCGSPDELPAPLPHEEANTSFPLTTPTLTYFRAHVQQIVAGLNYCEQRQSDFVTAVGEAAMNAVVHGGGGEGRVRVDRESAKVQVWVTDRGTGIDRSCLHRATLERGYTTSGSMGYGFFLMLKTTDRIYLLSTPQGTTVVLEQDRNPVDPLWGDLGYSLGHVKL